MPDLNCINVYDASSTITGFDCSISSTSPYYASGTYGYYTGLNKSESILIICVIIGMLFIIFLRFLMSPTKIND